MVKKKSEQIDFESSLQKLSDIVQKMEEGKLSLQEALDYFEKGIQLTCTCQKALAEAEQKVDILTQKNGSFELEPLKTDDL